MQSWRWPAVTLAASVLFAGSAGAVVSTGKPAPGWSGKTVQGKAIASSQYKGKVVLLNFFNAY